MPKISVIIPCYNQGQYIHDALNSIFAQTFQDIEVIIVNDGSTDEETIECLQKINHPQVKIIHQENKGLGGARNTGIENSTGDYITFLDADDWLDKSFLEVLYDLCSKNEADMACAVLTRINSEKETPMDLFENIVVSSFAQKISYLTNGSTCAKLYKKNIFDDIRFREKIYYEDNPVIVKILDKTDKVVYTNKVKYYYRENLESITLNSKIAEKRNYDKLFILNNICEIIENKSAKEKDLVLSVFLPILFEEKMYLTNREYRKQVKIILGGKIVKYIKDRTFLQKIFSVTNSLNRTHKVITILGFEIKVRKKNYKKTIMEE